MNSTIRWVAYLFASVWLLTSIGVFAEDNRKKAPEGVELYIISPADGTKVKSPVTVQFGLSGIEPFWCAFCRCHTLDSKI